MSFADWKDFFNTDHIPNWSHLHQYLVLDHQLLSGDQWRVIQDSAKLHNVFVEVDDRTQDKKHHYLLIAFDNRLFYIFHLFQKVPKTTLESLNCLMRLWSRAGTCETENLHTSDLWYPKSAMIASPPNTPTKTQNSFLEIISAREQKSKSRSRSREAPKSRPSPSVDKSPSITPSPASPSVLNQSSRVPSRKNQSPKTKSRQSKKESQKTTLAHPSAQLSTTETRVRGLTRDQISPKISSDTDTSFDTSSESKSFKPSVGVRPRDLSPGAPLTHEQRKAVSQLRKKAFEHEAIAGEMSDVQKQYKQREDKLIQKARVLYGYNIVKRIAQGGFGNVYETIDGRVLKMVDLSIEDQQSFERESDLAMKLGSAGVGPTVFEVQIERSKAQPRIGAIYMEKMDMTLKNWFSRASGNAWIRPLLDVIERLAMLQILCTDLKLDNTMVNIGVNNKITKLVLIDFGAGYCQEQSTVSPETLAFLMKFVFFFNSVRTRTHFKRIREEMKVAMQDEFETYRFQKDLTPAELKTYLVGQLKHYQSVAHYFQHPVTLGDIDRFILT